MNLIFTLQTPSTPTIDQIGGKGLSLILSAKNGYNVPSAVILSADFFTKWIKQIKSTSEWQSLTQAKGDALIAATACVKNIALVTTNPRHFQPIVELTVMIFPDDFKEATNV